MIRVDSVSRLSGESKAQGTSETELEAIPVEVVDVRWIYFLRHRAKTRKLKALL